MNSVSRMATIPAAAAGLGTMHMFNMGRHQLVVQPVVIPMATTVLVLVVLMVVEDLYILWVLVALVGMEMGLMVVLLLEEKALSMADKAVLGIRLVIMALMADLVVVVDRTLALAAVAAIPVVAAVVGLIPVMVVAVVPI